MTPKDVLQERRAFLTTVGVGLAAIACGSGEEPHGGEELREGSDMQGLCVAWPPAGVVLESDTYLAAGAPNTYKAWRIPAGVTATLCADATIGMLIVEGTLVFDPNASVTLKSYGNVVLRGSGVLRMKPASAAQVHRLQFTKVNEGQFRGGMIMLPLNLANTDTDPNSMHNMRDDVGLWVTEQGVLDLQGTPRGDGTTTSQTWKRSSSYSPSYPNWRAGDTVLQAPVVDKTDPNHLTFKYGKWPLPAGTPPKATTYSRTGAAVDYYAEVFNLTRNVIICGEGAGGIDPQSVTSGWVAGSDAGLTAISPSFDPAVNGRAHVMFVGCTVPQTIKYVRLEKLGPRKSDPVNTTAPVGGRYALHFHMCDNAMSCSTVEGVVAVMGGNRAFVPHKTHGIKFHDCIAFYNYETSYWWDAPAGTENNGSDRITFDHCAAAAIQCDPAFRGYDTYGFSLGQGATYAVTNRCTDCVTVASMGNSSGGGFTWPGVANLKPNAWVMDNCVSHNNKSLGAYIWQNDNQDHFITRFTAYFNGAGGISHGAYGNKYTYDGLLLFGVGGPIGVTAQAFTSAPQPNNVQLTNSVFDGAGTATCFYIGHHFADASGAHPALIKDCTFRGAPPGLAVYVGETVNSGTLPGFFDFLNVSVIDVNGTHELLPADFANLATGAVASSIFRIQHADGSSWQYTSSTGWVSTAANLITSDSRYQVRAVPATPAPVSCAG